MNESRGTPACGDPLDDISVIARTAGHLDAASGPPLCKLQINHTMPRSKARAGNELTCWNIEQYQISVAAINTHCLV